MQSIISNKDYDVAVIKYYKVFFLIKGKLCACLLTKTRQDSDSQTPSIHFNQLEF